MALLHSAQVLDSQNMVEMIGSWPRIIEEVISLFSKFDLSRVRDHASEIKNIVLVGMGGSGISGDLIQELFATTLPVPVLVHKDYRLPGFVGKKTLVVLVSYSGNTEETVSAFHEALTRGAFLVSISSNGTLEQLSKEHDTLFFKVQGGYQPRAALPYLLTPLLLLFHELFPEQVELPSWGDVTSRLKKEFESPSLLELAPKFQGKLPYILSARPFASVGYRFQCQLNENAKFHAIHYSIPEHNHNAIVPFVDEANDSESFLFVIITSGLEHARNKLRLQYVAELLKSQNKEVLEITLTPLSSLIATIYVGIYQLDLLSVELAFLHEKDPNAIPAIKRLKEFLASKKTE